MPTGLQMAQIVHGAIEFAFKHPELIKNWYELSNYVAILAVDNEEQLISIIQKAERKNIKHAVFCEPDQDDAVTAVVLEPSLDARKLSSYIKLAG